MIERSKLVPRRGVTVVECAVVYPLTLLLLIGLIVGGLGVFRYQEMAWLSREAARYAAVRGSEYQKETSKTPPTQQQIIDDVVLKMAAGINSQKLTVKVELVDKGNGTVSTWDSSTKSPTSTLSSGETVANHVRVSLSYDWIPEAFLVGPIRLESVCEIPMAF
jgi:Flp pilus assembly protein TadG